MDCHPELLRFDASAIMILLDKSKCFVLTMRKTGSFAYINVLKTYFNVLKLPI